MQKVCFNVVVAPIKRLGSALKAFVDKKNYHFRSMTSCVTAHALHGKCKEKICCSKITIFYPKGRLVGAVRKLHVLTLYKY